MEIKNYSPTKKGEKLVKLLVKLLIKLGYLEYSYREEYEFKDNIMYRIY